MAHSNRKQQLYNFAIQTDGFYHCTLTIIPTDVLADQLLQVH